jgi:long-chain acyl-CoA synthetase
MDLDTLPAFINHWAKECPDQVWLRDLNENGSTDYTWKDASQRINAVAANLEERFAPSSKIVVLSENCAHWCMADLAVIASGNVTVGLFTTLPRPTAKYILDFTDTKAIFVGQTSNWDAVSKVLPEGVALFTLPGVEIDQPHEKWEDLLEAGSGRAPRYQPKPDDLISLVFTSGTTGVPKGVMQTHSSNIIPIRRGDDIFGVEGVTPRYFSYLPLAHIAERQIVEFSSIVRCGEVSFNQSLETLVPDMQRTKPHLFFGAPRVWEQFQQAIVAKFGGREALDAAMANDKEAIGKMIVDALGLSEVVYCLTAAAPTPPALIQWYEDAGLKLMEGFGQTEAMGVVLSTEENRRIGSIGKPATGVEYRISDEGELIIRADGCTPGYYKMPEKTDELIQDGWLHTGDKVRVDEDGFLYITGRVKDYFKTIQGKFVAPPPIEGKFAVNPHAEQQCLLGRGYSKTVMVTVLSAEAQSQEPSVIEAAILRTVDQINNDIEKHARIGAVVIDIEPWSIENEILTPTLKIRREKIEDRYGEKAESLARESAEQRSVLVHWH